jgi:hypothetical protein
MYYSNIVTILLPTFLLLHSAASFQPVVPLFYPRTASAVAGGRGDGGGYDQDELDNHADQMNPNNDAYYSSRDDDFEYDDGNDVYSQDELDNHADQTNPNKRCLLGQPWKLAREQSLYVLRFGRQIYNSECVHRFQHQ